MKYVIPFFVAVTTISCLSCNSNSKKTMESKMLVDTTKTVENKIMIPASSCYSAVTGKDTVFLKVEKFPNVVTGKLLYKNYQKDDNTGTFDGILKDDTLIATYTFISEGKTSKRQIAFIIKDELATEGYGPMEEKEGQLAFKNTAQLVFGKGSQLKKVDCGEN